MLLYFKHVVTIVDDGWTMGNEYDGLVVGREDVLEQLSLGVWVEGAGSLIEEHDGTVAQQGTGYGDALYLPLGESSSLFGTRTVESLR